jgi:hypothetical protein
MAVKVIWKQTKTYSGMTTPAVKVAAVDAGVMPARNSRSRPPMNGFSAPTASGPKVSD